MIAIIAPTQQSGFEYARMAANLTGYPIKSFNKQTGIIVRSDGAEFMVVTEQDNINCLEFENYVVTHDYTTFIDRVRMRIKKHQPFKKLEVEK